ncbi:MAG: LCP family protein [Oscillospiraceae bacterium]|jgi:LCP family protein required for cell wall assembly|nr:LCP family protein [Oscillospiraceae bacterium]
MGIKGKRIAPKTAKAEKAKTPRGKLSKRQKWLVAAGVAAAVPLLAFASWRLLVRPPPLPPVESPAPPLLPSMDPSNPLPPPSGTQIYRPPDIAFDQDIRTVLIAGVYDGTNTDSIMVARLNYKANEMHVVSIQRDILVMHDGRARKVNSVVSHAGGEPGGGMAELVGALEYMLGFKIGSTVYVKFTGVEQLVDSVGGVEFDVPTRLYKPEEGINLQKGLQTLSGKQAIMLLRYRGYSGGVGGLPSYDYGRMYIQQQFLKAAARQLLVPQNITKAPEWARIFEENVTTSLKTGEILWFVEQSFGIDSEKITFATLPSKTDDRQLSAGQGSYDYIIADEALVMINEMLNPYNMDITRDMVSWYMPWATRDAKEH